MLLILKPACRYSRFRILLNKGVRVRILGLGGLLVMNFIHSTHFAILQRHGGINGRNPATLLSSSSPVPGSLLDSGRS